MQKDGWKVATRHRLANAEYPTLWVYWRQEGQAWAGECVVWLDGDLEGCTAHRVSLGQTVPLGGITATLDDCGGGCWSMAGFDGTGITERDLQWATAWAAEGIARKHAAGGKAGDWGPCGERKRPEQDFPQ